MKRGGLAAALLGGLCLAGCGDDAGSTYTLYRTAYLGSEKVHIATFDARQSDDYNHTNCEIARELFQSHPGVLARYWCEAGRA